MYDIAILASLAALAAACGLPGHIERRDFAKTAIQNVHVFDGTRFGAQTTVVIIGGIISNAPAAGAMVYDGKGGYLIPDLIDTHCHVTQCSYLNTMQQYGITTALDMGTFPYSAISACHSSGVTDVKGSGAAGIVNGTALSHVPGFPLDSYIPNPAAGKNFVRARVAEGVDYIKVFLDPLGPDEATLAAIVQAAHAAGKKVITHAPEYSLYSEAEAAGVDIPCHTPLDKALDAASVAKLRHSVPTLIMMQSIVNNTGAPYAAYQYAAEASVTTMYHAGVPIAAGSDANTSPFVPANPPFGLSLHEELQLLVGAGLSNVDALRAATSVAASTFGLYNRGAIKPGLRADLVLLSADPTIDISNTLKITKVWVEGSSS
jgi:imidazolonepropionase-like amidohydrolase